MMTRITVTLEQSEREALRVLSLRERRDMKDQAALFIREKLIERGMLPADTSSPAIPSPIAQPAAPHV